MTLDAYTQALSSQFSDIAKDANYDDETGYYGLALNSDKDDYTGGRQLTGVYNNALSAKEFTANGHNVYLNDVDFAENVIIGDNRDKDDRDADVYTSEITTINQLNRPQQ